MTSAPPTPLLPQFLCTPGTPPPTPVTGWVCESSTVHLWVFPTYICLQPMTQIPTTLPCRKPLRGGPGLSAFFFFFLSSTSFLPQGPLGWIHFAEFLDQPGWMAGNILACYLPGNSVSPAASSQEPESHSLGSEREWKGSLVQLLPETILGTGVRWTLGVKPAPPLSSLVTWNKWLPEPQLFNFVFICKAEIKILTLQVIEKDRWDLC